MSYSRSRIFASAPGLASMLLSLPLVAAAQGLKSTPTETLDFRSVPEVVPSARVQLANGKKIEDVDMAVWSAVAVTRTRSGRLCTSTLVGPRVLLTAAHCVDAMDKTNKTRTISGTVTFGGSEIPIFDCVMHPNYAKADIRTDGVPRSSEDYALCELATPVNHVTQESIDTVSLVKATPILLTGYGCTTVKVSANTIVGYGADTYLRIGNATIDALGVLDETDKQGAYVRTRSDEGQPILCPGDSGGPAFSGASTSEQAGPKRRVLAVNSKVRAVPRSEGHTFFSFAASLLAPSFRTFQTRWSSKYPESRKICGIDVSPGTGSCRL